MIRRDFCKTSLALAGWTLRNGATATLAVDSAYAAAPAAAPAAAELPHAPGLTKYVHEFIVTTKYEDIPADVIALGKKTILDGFGLALAGSVSTAGPHIRKYVETLGISGGKATVIGTSMKTHPRFAALANGISIHADDYDDTGSALHVAAPVLPAAFALCEVGHKSGKDLMLAFHVGVEVENKIGDAIAPRHQEDGYHTTGTCGTFGSAAACAKLLGLDGAQTAIALGVAGSGDGGPTADF